MSFTVQAHALDGYAAQIGRAGDDASATKTYLDGYAIPPGWTGALIALIGPAAADSMNASIDICQKLSAISYVSQSGLTEAGKYYRETDAQAAAGIEYDHPLGFLDNLSPSHWALEAFNAVFGFNPLEHSLTFYLGDWQAFGKAGKAMENAAAALGDLAFTVQGGAVALHPAWWQGHAAETAYQHFARMAQEVDGLADPMRQIAEQFSAISQGVWHSCESVSGIIKGMIDAAAVAGLSIVGGSLAAATGVGALIGYGLAAVQVAYLLEQWARATALMNNIYATVQAGAGIIASQSSRLQGASLPQLSGAGYAHPAVG